MEIGTTEGRTKGNRVHYLIIVARTQSGLYEHLKEAFSGDKKVEVILDRRQSQRRRGDRRRRSDIDEQLRSLGCVVARVEDTVRRADSRTG